MPNITRERLEHERGRVFDALERAARLVGQRDAYILEHDVREEAIAYRLAHNLENILLDDRTLGLDGFSVDCDYNCGNGYRREYLKMPWPKGTRSQLRKHDQQVRPNIIVHQRGTDWACLNLLMIEVRKSTTISQTARQFAYLKCAAYRESGLNYIFAAYICFVAGHGLKSNSDPWTELRKFPDQ